MRERELLEHIYRSNAQLESHVTIPPGDDMGAITIGGTQVLVTVDQVADGVHVDVSQTPLKKVGRKAITRNLSDVAAMAALPVGAVVAASLPKDFGQDRAILLFDAMRRTAAEFGCPLLGGDISMWDQSLLLTVTMLAEPADVDPVLRCGAEVGDAVYVTGRLGGGLETVAGLAHHLEFEPRIGLARRLASTAATRPHCMIDLSDGLAKDLGHLCEASGVSATIDAGRLPISTAAQRAAERRGGPAWQHAVGDGEDYELLFTVPPEPVCPIPSVLDGVPITSIGTIARAGPGPRVGLRLADGDCVNLDSFGWEHRS